MYKKGIVLFCMILVSTFLSACFDAVEINDYAYVSMIGMDLGISHKLRLTMQIPSFQQKGSKSDEGGREEEPTDKENIIIEAPSVISGVALINSSIPITLNFMHLKAVVISEDMATSGKVGEYVSSLLRYRQIRANTQVIICKGRAEEFVKATKPYLGALVTETLEELTARSERTGFFPNITLGDMRNSIKSPFNQLLGIYGAVNKGENLKDEGSYYEGGYKIPGDFFAGDTPTKGGQEIELLGSIISDGDKMVGKLTGFETQMLLIMRNELNRVAFTIEDPMDNEYIIPIEIKEFDKLKIDVDISEEKPRIKAKVGMEGDITTIQSGENYDDPKNQHIVEKAVEDFIKTGLERTFAKCKVLNSDVFNFGYHAVRKFSTIQEWESYDWIKKLGDAELQVEVDFRIRRTGKLLKSFPIISSEGNEW